MRDRWLTLRVVLGIGAGIAVGIALTFLLEHAILAAILGSLTAVAVAMDHLAIKRYATVGCLTGAGVGLYVCARGDALFAEPLVRSGPFRVIVELLATMVVSGLVCGAYCWVTGKVKKLYDEGRGPFF